MTFSADEHALYVDNYLYDRFPDTEAVQLGTLISTCSFSK